MCYTARSIAIALLLATLPGSAACLDLIWSTGARGLAVHETATCTLLVVGTAPTDSLPREWRLVWTGTTGAERGISLSTEAPPPGIAGVCEIRPASSTTGILARADTVLHCSGSAVGRATLARYFLRVAGGTVARIALVYRYDGVPDEASQTDASEVLLNGGGTSAYPPVADRLSVSSVEGQVVFAVSGWFLGGARSASLAFDGGAPITAVITAQTNSFLTVRAPVPPTWRTGYLHLLGPEGTVGAIEVPARGGSSDPGWSPDRVLVRFNPGHAEPPPNRTQGTPSEFTFSSPALRESLSAAGVVSMERLLPWFRHEDVTSANSLGEPVTLEDLADLYVVHLAPSFDSKAARDRLAGLPQVRYANLDLSVGSYFEPNDPYYVANLQWGLRNTGQTLCGYTGVPNMDIGASGAWDRSHGTPSVKIAILDTGIDHFHPDLLHAVLDTSFVPNTTPFDDATNHHGTAVAGIAAGKGNNGFGIAGVAWNATPVAIKVLDSNNGGTIARLIQGIDRARVKGYPIVNMSLGAPRRWFDPPPPAADLTALNNACYNAFIVGNLLVASSGNTGQGSPPSDALSDPFFNAYPAAFHQRVWAVGASFPEGNRWRDYTASPVYCAGHPGDCEGSNWGSWLDVLAPGGRFIVTAASSTPPDTFYHLRNCNLSTLTQTGFGRTSAAAPFVSGIAGLLKSFMPNLTGDDLAQIIGLNANYSLGFDPINRWDPYNGRGIARGDIALNFIAPPKTVIQNYVAGNIPSSYLLVSDTVPIPFRTFKNVPGLPATYTTSCWRIHLKGAGLHGGFNALPKLWVRPSGTMGWRDTATFDHSFEVPWGRATSIGTDSSKFETYVYRIPLPAGGEQYFPAIPQLARVAYTVVGTLRTVGVAGAGPATKLEVASSPNPARHGVWVDLAIPAKGWVRLSVFDIGGRHVATLADGPRDSGHARLWWDARNRDGGPCRAGVFWLRAEVDGAVESRRFVLLGS